MKHIQIPIPLAQILVNYLFARPYGEVAEMIAAIKALPVMDDEAVPAAEGGAAAPA